MTTWEWGDPRKYLHDLIASDRRDPTVDAYGPLYGSPEYATDVYPILDPKTHRVTTFTAPVRDADTPEAFGPGHAAIATPMAPSAYWGEEKIWDTKAKNHNGMIDRKGRVWFAAMVRGPKNPAFCTKGSDHPSAKLFPVEQANRHITMLDPKTMKYTFVDTCFQTHHLQFGYDANDTLWTSGGGPAFGWINTKMFHETSEAARSQRVDGARPRHQGGERWPERPSRQYPSRHQVVSRALWYSVVMTGNRQMHPAKSNGRDHPYVEWRPGVCGREPVIVGTGFPVRSVVTSIYRPGMTPEEMLKAWPYLTLAHVHDALSFYHDHRAVIDRAIRENRETAVRRGAVDLDAVPKGRGVSRGAAPTYPFRDVDRLSGMHIGFIT